MNPDFPNRIGSSCLSPHTPPFTPRSSAAASVYPSTPVNYQYLDENEGLRLNGLLNKPITISQKSTSLISFLMELNTLIWGKSFDPSFIQTASLKGSVVNHILNGDHIHFADIDVEFFLQPWINLHQLHGILKKWTIGHGINLEAFKLVGNPGDPMHFLLLSIEGIPKKIDIQFTISSPTQCTCSYNSVRIDINALMMASLKDAKVNLRTVDGYNLQDSLNDLKLGRSYSRTPHLIFEGMRAYCTMLTKGVLPKSLVDEKGYYSGLRAQYAFSEYIQLEKNLMSYLPRHYLEDIKSQLIYLLNFEEIIQRARDDEIPQKEKQIISYYLASLISRSYFGIRGDDLRDQNRANQLFTSFRHFLYNQFLANNRIIPTEKIDDIPFSLLLIESQKATQLITAKLGRSIRNKFTKNELPKLLMDPLFQKRYSAFCDLFTPPKEQVVELEIPLIQPQSPIPLSPQLSRSDEIDRFITNCNKSASDSELAEDTLLAFFTKYKQFDSEQINELLGIIKRMNRQSIDNKQEMALHFYFQMLTKIRLAPELMIKLMSTPVEFYFPQDSSQSIIRDSLKQVIDILMIASQKIKGDIYKDIRKKWLEALFTHALFETTSRVLLSKYQETSTHQKNTQHLEIKQIIKEWIRLTLSPNRVEPVAPEISSDLFNVFSVVRNGEEYVFEELFLEELTPIFYLDVQQDIQELPSRRFLNYFQSFTSLVIARGVPLLEVEFALFRGFKRITSKSSSLELAKERIRKIFLPALIDLFPSLQQPYNDFLAKTELDFFSENLTALFPDLKRPSNIQDQELSYLTIGYTVTGYLHAQPGQESYLINQLSPLLIAEKKRLYSLTIAERTIDKKPLYELIEMSISILTFLKNETDRKHFETALQLFTESIQNNWFLIESYKKCYDALYQTALYEQSLLTLLKNTPTDTEEQRLFSHLYEIIIALQHFGSNQDPKTLEAIPNTLKKLEKFRKNQFTCVQEELEDITLVVNKLTESISPTIQTLKRFLLSLGLSDQAHPSASPPLSKLKTAIDFQREARKSINTSIQESYACLTKGLLLFPDHIPLLIQLVETLEKCGNIALSTNEPEQCLLNYKQAITHLEAARKKLEQISDKGVSLKEFKEVESNLLLISKKLKEYYQTLGKILNRMNSVPHFARGIDCFAELSRLYPSSRELHTLFYSYLYSSHYSVNIKDSQKTQEAQKNRIIMLNLAEAHVAVKNWTEAICFYDLAFPNGEIPNTSFLHHKGECLIHAKRWQNAYDLYSQALTDTPSLCLDQVKIVNLTQMIFKLKRILTYLHHQKEKFQISYPQNTFELANSEVANSSGSTLESTLESKQEPSTLLFSNFNDLLRVYLSPNNVSDSIFAKNILHLFRSDKNLCFEMELNPTQMQEYVILRIIIHELLFNLINDRKPIEAYQLLSGALSKRHFTPTSDALIPLNRSLPETLLSDLLHETDSSTDTIRLAFKLLTKLMIKKYEPIFPLHNIMIQFVFESLERQPEVRATTSPESALSQNTPTPTDVLHEILTLEELKITSIFTNLPETTSTSSSQETSTAGLSLYALTQDPVITRETFKPLYSSFIFFHFTAMISCALRESNKINSKRYYKRAMKLYERIESEGFDQTLTSHYSRSDIERIKILFINFGQVDLMIEKAFQTQNLALFADIFDLITNIYSQPFQLAISSAMHFKICLIVEKIIGILNKTADAHPMYKNYPTLILLSLLGAEHSEMVWKLATSTHKNYLKSIIAESVKLSILDPQSRELRNSLLTRLRSLSTNHTSTTQSATSSSSNSVNPTQGDDFSPSILESLLFEGFHWIKEARKFRDNERYVESIGAMKTAISLHGKLSLKLKRFFESKDNVSVFSRYSDALVEVKKYLTKAYSDVGECYYSLNTEEFYEQAITYFKQVHLEFDPQNNEAIYQLGFFLCLTKRPEAAQEAIVYLSKGDQTNIQILFQLGQAHFNLKNLDQSLYFLEKADGIEFDQSEKYGIINLLAQVAALTNQFEKAIMHYQRMKEMAIEVEDQQEIQETIDYLQTKLIS